MIAPDSVDAIEDDGVIKLKVAGVGGSTTCYELTEPVAIKLFTDLGKVLGPRLEKANREKLSHVVEPK